MSKRKRKKLESHLRRIQILDLSIKADASERDRLRRECDQLRTDLQIADWPKWKRDSLRSVFGLGPELSGNPG